MSKFTKMVQARIDKTGESWSTAARQVRAQVGGESAEEVRVPEKKRNQHYVWQHYLKAWALDGRLWCQRGATRFRANSSKIANETDFYRLKELSAADLQVIEALIDRMGEHLRELARGWIPHFRIFHQIKREYAASGQQDPRVEAALDEAINDLEEDMHAGIEADAVPLLSALRSADVSFLEDDDKFIPFARFIAAQQLRTPGVQRLWITAGAVLPGFNAEASVGLLRTIFATNLGFAYFQRRRTLRLTFLDAPPSVEFVTGDQPVINMRSDRADPDTPPTELELYYPLTPERSLLLDFDGGPARERRALTKDEVDAYNSLIAAHCESQLYARTEGAFPKKQVPTRVPSQNPGQRARRSLIVYVEGETSERAGAGAMFQIVEVQEDGREIDRPVNNGIHFTNVAEVERYLAQEVFPGDDVDVTLETS